MISLDGSGLERKAATQVREFEKLAFAYFALVSLTSVHKIKKMGPGISGSPLITADYVAASIFFFSEKWPPYFWKPLTCGYVAQGCFFFPEKRAPIFLEARSGHGS